MGPSAAWFYEDQPSPSLKQQQRCCMAMVVLYSYQLTLAEVKANVSILTPKALFDRNDYLPLLKGQI